MEGGREADVGRETTGGSSSGGSLNVAAAAPARVSLLLLLLLLLFTRSERIFSYFIFYFLFFPLRFNIESWVEVVTGSRVRKKWACKQRTASA